MAASSPSFAEACGYVKTWIDSVLDVRAQIGAAGQVASDSDVCIAPWRIGSPSRERERGEECFMAIGYFCVTVGSGAPELGCARLDAIYFAAFGSIEVTLSPLDPPTPYWAVSPGLNVTLTRLIERPVDVRLPGRVEHPLIVDIHPDPAAFAVAKRS